MSITPKKRAALARENWAVETAHGMTQNSIAQHLADHGRVGYGTGNIPYSEKEVPAYIVPFFVIEWLLSKKTNLGLQFTIYHKKVSQDDWAQWREEKKTAKEKVVLGIKDGIIKRATQIRQRSKKRS